MTTQDKQIVRKLRRNPNPAEVANTLDVHPSTVYRCIKRNGVELKLLKAIAEGKGTEKACFRYLAQNKVPKTTIARKFGVSPQYISQVV